MAYALQMPLKLLAAALVLAMSAGLDVAWIVNLGLRKSGSPTVFLMIAFTTSVIVGLLLRQDWARKLVPLLAGIHMLGVILWCSVLVMATGWTPRSEMGLAYVFMGVDLLCAFFVPWAVTRPEVRGVFK